MNLKELWKHITLQYYDKNLNFIIFGEGKK